MKGKIYKHINKPDFTCIRDRHEHSASLSRTLKMLALALPLSIVSIADAQAGKREFNVTIKSFIKPLDMKNLGSFKRKVLWGSVPDVGKNVKLRAFAEVTRRKFREDPWHSRRDKQYRIYSNLKINAQCNGNRLRITRSHLTRDVGKEGPLQPPAAIGKIHRKQIGNVYDFKWYMRARPHRLAEPAIKAVSWRNNPFIWQKTGGRVFCRNGQPQIVTNNFQGSKFPSHRLWINGRATRSKNQGQLKELWQLDRPRL